MCPTADRRSRIRRIALDAFAIADVGALIINEFVAFPTGGTGFRVYTLVLAALAVTVWLALRRFEFPLWATVSLELALLGHIAGRLVMVGDTNLYRALVLGMPGDKLLHAFNTGVAAVFVTVLMQRAGFRVNGWGGFIAVMAVSGLGALIEIIEYIGTLVLPHTNVGGYANNMQDLIANLAGAIVGWSAGAWGLRRESATPAGAPPA